MTAVQDHSVQKRERIDVAYESLFLFKFGNFSRFHNFWTLLFPDVLDLRWIMNASPSLELLVTQIESCFLIGWTEIVDQSGAFPQSITWIYLRLIYCGCILQAVSVFFWKGIIYALPFLTYLKFSQVSPLNSCRRKSGGL